MKLAKYVVAHRYGNKGIFGAGSNQVIFKDLSKWSNLVKISSLLIENKELEELQEDVKIKYPNLTNLDVTNAYNYLLNNNYLMGVNEFDNHSRHSRTNLFYRLVGTDPKNSIEKLKSSAIAIIGCGGIGNYLSQILTTSGIGKLLLVDADKIEMSNLSRQFMFTEFDVGKLKVDILERELKNRNSNVEIIKYSINIDNKNSFYKILDKFDLLLLSADTPSEIIYWTNEYCVENNIPYINIGYINDIAVYGPFVIPGKSACFECSHIIQDPLDDNDTLFEEIHSINSNFKTASYPTVNAMASSMALNDVFKFICGYGDISALNQRIGIHSLSLKIETQKIAKNKECRVCSTL